MVYISDDEHDPGELKRSGNFQDARRKQLPGLISKSNTIPLFDCLGYADCYDGSQSENRHWMPDRVLESNKDRPVCRSA